MGPADVERRQPREPRFERRVHRRQAHELTVVVERAEQGGAIGDDRRVEGHVAGDAVLAGAIRIPRRDVGQEYRCLDQVTVVDSVLDLDVLRPVDGGHQGDVARLQTTDAHDQARPRPYNCEVSVTTTPLRSTQSSHSPSLLAEHGAVSLSAGMGRYRLVSRSRCRSRPRRRRSCSGRRADRRGWTRGTRCTIPRHRRWPRGRRCRDHLP